MRKELVGRLHVVVSGDLRQVVHAEEHQHLRTEVCVHDEGVVGEGMESNLMLALKSLATSSSFRAHLLRMRLQVKPPSRSQVQG